MMNQASKEILIIEDDLEIRESLIEILGEEGYLVRGSSNGKEALDYLNLSKTLPALLLLDLMMPVMDGFQFRAEQMKNEKLAQIPTVVLSANSDLARKVRGIGISQYIKKPFELDSLIKIVRANMDLS